MSKEIRKIRRDSLIEVTPASDSQQAAFDEYWEEGNNLILSGSAGTGKTFIAMHMGLETILDPQSEQNKLIIVRSIVPTRDIGFLPGDEEEKMIVYARPYIDLADELITGRNAWEKLTAHGQVEFQSTSFIRGTTWNNAVILIDEMQNMSLHELDSIITRVGESSRIIFCGDYYQSDFTREEERSGLKKFLAILDTMPSFSKIEFTWKDIIRSKLVREYIIAKERLQHA